MGDRAGVVVRSYGEEVALYTHWGGHSLESDLREALDRGRSRWNDGSYLARIILEGMIPEDERGSLTGFGIAARPTGEEHPLFTVDCDRGTVMGNGELPVPIEEWVASRAPRGAKE